MSSEGLPIDGIVDADIVLGARSTQQATDEAKSSLSADSAAQSADAAFKFSRQAKDAVSGADAAAERAEAAAENAQNIADANTYYITSSDPDGTIAGIAGTPDGKIFRVAIKDDSGVTVIFKYYKNAAGTADYINAEASARLIYQMEQAVNYMKLISPQGQSNTLSGYQVMVTDFTGKNGLFGVNDNGGFEVLGIDGDLQDYLTNLVSASFSSKISGYQVVIFAQDLKSVIFAIDDNGGLWLPGLNEPVQDAIGASGPSFVRPYNGVSALFADKTADVPLWHRAPVVTATPITHDGVSFMYDESGTLKSGLMPIRWPANEVYAQPREIPSAGREMHLHKQHIAPAENPAIAVIQGIDGGVVLIVAAQGDQPQRILFRRNLVFVQPAEHRKHRFARRRRPLAFCRRQWHAKTAGLTNACVVIVEAGDGFFDQIADHVVILDQLIPGHLAGGHHRFGHAGHNGGFRTQEFRRRF